MRVTSSERRIVRSLVWWLVYSISICLGVFTYEIHVVLHVASSHYALDMRLGGREGATTQALLRARVSASAKKKCSVGLQCALLNCSSSCPVPTAIIEHAVAYTHTYMGDKKSNCVSNRHRARGEWLGGELLAFYATKKQQQTGRAANPIATPGSRHKTH